MTIGFIGLGNMAKAMISGIIRKQLVNPEDIIGSAPTEAHRQALEETYGIRTTESNRQVVREADIVFLAVKPIQLPVVLEEITETVNEQQLAACRTRRRLSVRAARRSAGTKTSLTKN